MLGELLGMALDRFYGDLSDEGRSAFVGLKPLAMQGAYEMIEAMELFAENNKLSEDDFRALDVFVVRAELIAEALSDLDEETKKES